MLFLVLILQGEREINFEVPLSGSADFDFDHASEMAGSNMLLLYHEKQASHIDVVELSWRSICRVVVQEAALCGVHCLNTLLQGPYFSGFELGQVRPSLSVTVLVLCSANLQKCHSAHSLQIAQELDQMERAFMTEGGVDSADFLKFMGEDSGNVAESGLFSIQVASPNQQITGRRQANLQGACS